MEASTRWLQTAQMCDGSSRFPPTNGTKPQSSPTGQVPGDRCGRLIVSLLPSPPYRKNYPNLIHIQSPRWCSTPWDRMAPPSHDCSRRPPGQRPGLSSLYSDGERGPQTPNSSRFFTTTPRPSRCTPSARTGPILQKSSIHKESSLLISTCVEASSGLRTALVS